MERILLECRSRIDGQGQSKDSLKFILVKIKADLFKQPSVII